MSIEKLKGKEDFFDKISTWLILGIVILSALVIPNNDLFTIDSNTRLASTSVLLLLFGLASLKRNNIFTVDAIDLVWILLIIYTGLSAFWSMNSHYAIYGLVTTISLFLTYKACRTVDWESGNAGVYLYWILFTSLIAALGLEFYCVFVDYGVLKNYGKNLNMLGSLITLLLPFVLYDERRFSTAVGPILLIAAHVIIYKSGSAMVSIALLILTFFYALTFIKKRAVKKILIGAGSLLAIGLAVLIFNNKNIKNQKGGHVLKEFYSQSDRLQMWNNSLKLFKESPLIGVGTNNWELQNSKYGYNFARNKIFYLRSYRFNHAHNSFFQILSETGLIGILLYGAMIFALFLKIKQIEHFPLSRFQQASIASILLFTLLSFVYGAVYNHYRNFHGLTIILMLAISMSFDKDYSITETKKERTRNYLLKFLYMALSIFCLMYSINQIKAVSLSRQSIEYRRQTKIDEALKLSSQSYNLMPNSKNLEALTKLYERSKEWSTAEELYKAHLEKDQYNSSLLHNYANCLYELKKFKEALKVSKDCNTLDSAYLPNRLLLAKSEFKNGNSNIAKQQLNDIFETITTKKQNYNTYKDGNGQYENNTLKNRVRVLDNIEKKFNVFLKENQITIDN